MGEKTAGVGHFMIPTAPSSGTSCTSGAANTFTTTYVQLIASTVAALYITGIQLEGAAVGAWTYSAVQLATGAAGLETIVDQELIVFSTQSTTVLGKTYIWPPIPVAAATRIAVKTADSVGAKASLVTLICVAQANVVEMGITVGANIVTIAGQTAAATGTVTFPAGTIANTTNITGGTITTVTNLTNAATSGDLTATMKTSVQTAADAAITANATIVEINADVDELITTIGVAGAGLTGIASIGSVTGNVGGNVVGSVGSISGITFPTNFGATLITAGGHISNVDTLTTYTGNTPQTGDAFARLGAPAGASIAADLAEIEAETDGIAAIPTTTPLTAAQIATGVWQDSTAGDFTVASSAGQELFGISASVTDPWSVMLPGAYTAGEAGYILGNTLNVNMVEIAGSATAATALRDDILTPTYTIYVGTTPIA